MQSKSERAMNQKKRRLEREAGKPPVKPFSMQAAAKRLTKIVGSEEVIRTGAIFRNSK